ncbi:glycosyltransferase family 2 protein [Alcanivorax sp. 1008]|uniref:glycosyltransferase family 2 protein n=1 Tax=Alcanivorax sp. 1008 TaxID=2816853 RepID=UPI001D8861A9|nr:glycosyltransferase family 2 protein [Alcanivorax sp. 1008]MCC1498225.1 glycosyltransferase family 2 protein [Alcanivorax sp. 1008]
MKISVIMPVFNGEFIIDSAIQSVMAQTFRNWELIIINDGSNDDTAAILDALNDSRIRVVHQANSGASSARNVGLVLARGEYVTFLDADDCLPRDALKSRAAFLDKHPEVDIVNGSVNVMSAGNLIRIYKPDLTIGPLLDRLAVLDEGVFFNPMYMLRRKKIGLQRFPVGVSHCEDIIFFLSLAHQANLIYGAVPDVVYEYRIQPGSAMANLDGIERGYLELLRRAREMSRINDAMRKVQRRRVRRILFRSWLRRARPLRAIAALAKIYRMA